jgi:DNA helicase II / ATP-dependent DNA helicase PcrA
VAQDYVIQNLRPPVELHIDYAKELNQQQHAAVTALPAPSLVIAGAGSGKTRTLTYRVAYLLEQGIPADRILLLTFTNKAAREMMRRVSDLLEGGLSLLWGGTFHSVGSRILRRHADRLGYRPDFTILDREDARALLKTCIEETKIEHASRFPKADVLANLFSLEINTGDPLSKILSEQYDYLEPFGEEISTVARAFTTRKQKTNVMDFDDLLSLWLKLLRENEDLLELYQRRFQFLLVDEYQDTNRLQSDLIDLLAKRHGNVMVVGDDSQSIYSWRGANFKNILQFPERYPGAQVYRIETNYRSTPEILNLANAAIASNTCQYAKVLKAVRPSGERPVVASCEDGRQQAEFVAQRALQLRESGISLNDMAVLYRSHFHALELQMELTRRQIPFTITSGLRFFEQAHIKDVSAYIKWIHNPADELSFKRIIQLLPGIGGKGAGKLWSAIQAKDTPEAPLNSQPLAPVVQGCARLAPKKAQAAWAQLSATLSQLEDLKDQPSAMVDLILEAGYTEYLQDTFPNFRSRQEDLAQLSTFALQFKTTDDFLTQLALVTNTESEDEAAAGEPEERIRLSTIHQAKGLEFPVVFLIMLCEGLFPSTRSMDRIDFEEEERRLFYVAVTRAMDHLYLSYPAVRMTAGNSGEMFQRRSRFLAELPEELVDTWNLRSSLF